MEIKPVRRYRTPAYATNAILERHPELLRLVPKRWQSNPVVLTALTGICMMMVGSRAIAATAKNGDKAKPTPASKVAPIFVHGEGRGAFGRIAVSPPVFLSEDEARQVIVEEAKKSGIELKPDSMVLPKVALPVTDRYGWDDPPGKATKPKVKEQPLGLDGTDKKRSVSYEFVSTADFEKWERKDYKIQVSAWSYDISKAAGLVRDGLVKAKPAGRYAVFYDPLVREKRVALIEDKDGNTDWKATQAAHDRACEEARDEAKKLLGEQVKDFIKWLKAEGVI